ncbi:MAG: ribosomal protein S18-alanine N-acetyltransferase [Chloroflexota bacterium]
MEVVRYCIRGMRDEDIPQVSEIDHEAFPAESLFRPYSSYKQEIHSPIAHYLVASTYEYVDTMLVQRPQSWIRRFLGHRDKEGRQTHGQVPYILGFVGFWLMLNEAHIIAIAVRNAYRRYGIGEQLLISVLDKAADLKASLVTLEVRASNTVAQALYQKYGFRVVGRRPRYYSDNGEDAVLMSTEDITSAAFQAELQRRKTDHYARWRESTVVSAGVERN